MKIRSVRGLADVRGTDRVNRRAWKAAYDHIFPPELLDRDQPNRADLRERLEAIRSWTGAAFVAVAEAANDVSVADETEASAPPEGPVVGYSFVRWGVDTKSFVDSGDAGLKEIYVDPDHWNKGTGTALLERAEQAVPEEYDGLTLSMLAGNEAGRRFYERRGFTEIGTTTDEIGGNVYECVLFRKFIRDDPDS